MTNMEKLNICNISAKSVDKYLQFTGWERNYNFPNKNLMVYSINRNEFTKKIAIPSNEDFEGFYDTLYGVLSNLSNFEQRPIYNIAKDMLTTYLDRLEFRIITDFSNDGKLPIQYASNFIEGIKDLLLYSICAEFTPSPICFKATNKAKSHLRKFKLAQTEKGSFIVNIDANVVNDSFDEQTTFEGVLEESSIEHRIVRRISKAIQQVDDLTKDKSTISIMAERAFEDGMTANMCDALLRLKPEYSQLQDIQIESTIRYASVITKQPGYNKKNKMGTLHFLAMEELSKVYKSKIEIQYVELSGVITSMSTKKESDVKIIKLYTRVNGKNRIILVELNETQHRIACDAYKDGLEVMVSGELDMSGYNWKLDHVDNFIYWNA